MEEISDKGWKIMRANAACRKRGIKEGKTDE